MGSVRHIIGRVAPSPSTRHISSSSAVSEPDMPMADRSCTYIRTPRNGIATPQYFIESRESGIW